MLSVERALAHRAVRPEVVAALLDRPLACLDVGARGGIHPRFAPFAESCRFYLVEGDDEEAARLRAQGHVVIPSLVAGHRGTAELKITASPGASSLLEPTGHIMGFYGGPDQSRFAITRRLSLPAVTIDDLAAAHGVAFDLVKLDTQGSELDILSGMTTTAPLFLECEVSAAQLYQGQGTLFDIGALLYGRGYLMADLTLRRCRPRPHGAWLARGERAGLGIPLHGDAWFMPDWTRPEGQAIIARSPRAWAALMLIFGHGEILRHALRHMPLPEGEADALLRLIGAPAGA